MKRKNLKTITLSAIGLDSPGLVSKLANRIYELDGNIIEMEENNRKGMFSIFYLIDFSRSELEYQEIEKKLKQIEEETSLKILISDKFEGYSLEKIESKNLVITILGLDQPGVIAKISSLLHKYNINIEKANTLASGIFFSMEILANIENISDGSLDSYEFIVEKMKKELKELCGGINQSVVIQSENMFGKMKKLIVFDVEATLIKQTSLKNFIIEAIQLLKKTKSEEILKSRDYLTMQVLIENISSFQGINIEEFEKLGDILILNDGVLELFQILKAMGFKIALISSGFGFLIKKIFDTMEIDYAFSNSLRLDKEKKILGNLEDPIITDLTKNTILDFIINIEHLEKEHVISIGDGSPHSEYMKDVGLSIAFNPETSNVTTDGFLGSDSILHILYCLGIPKTELDSYLKKSEK